MRGAKECVLWLSLIRTTSLFFSLVVSFRSELTEKSLQEVVIRMKVEKLENGRQ